MPTFTGDNSDNIFTGGAENDTAHGNGGNDTLSGGGGNDTLAGGTGADILDGGDGDDVLFSGNFISIMYNQVPPFTGMDLSLEVDTLRGGADDDRIYAGYGDNVDGGTQGYWGDSLVISFLAAPTGVTADFQNATLVIGGGTITGIEGYFWVEGSNFDDDITMNSHSDSEYLYGMGGNDRLVAGYYTRRLDGGEGNDILDGRASGSHLDRLDGGAGDDIIYTPPSFAKAYGGDGNDTIYGHGTTYGGAGNDTIILGFSYYTGIVYGEDGNDEIRGAADRGNTLSGGAGADVLIGNNGNDNLSSGDFLPFSSTPADDMGLERDQLSSGAGNDLLAIGYGDDADGGAGTDTLRLSLGGLGAGIAFDTSGIASGQPFTLGGGMIQGFETFAYVRGTEFSDTLTIATQATLLTVDAGAGDDVITSQGSSVSLSGGSGNDRFISGAAGDVFDGGVGTDTIDYSNATSGVTVTLAQTAGQSGSGAGGDQLVNVENIDGSAFGDTLNGNSGANQLNGGAGDDVLVGGAGNDLLIGGEGADVLMGGLGNDNYLVTDSNDQLLEDVDAGFDTIYTTTSLTIGHSLHIELLTAHNQAGTEALALIGNEFAQTILGNAGNNLIVAGGGGDILVGFGGNDDYLVSDARDYVGEDANGGFDTIYTTTSHTIGYSSHVELLTAHDQAGTEALALIGNQFGQTILGNAGNNLIVGGGGGDILVGFGGNDDYLVSDARDYVAEKEGGGFDSIYTTTSHTIGYSSHVELLTAHNQAGTEALTLIGNRFGQAIYGNAGSNLIIGGGGADVLAGLGGDDDYLVESQAEEVVEHAGGGTDSIYTLGSYALSAGAHVEQLIAHDQAGTQGITLTGNELANLIIGNAGANYMDGGAGTDVLIGGGGADAFGFTTALGGGNVDTLADFQIGVDVIVLDAGIFALAPGQLAAGAFHVGSAAADAGDRIIYDAGTGALFYDADGSGAGAAVQFGSIAAGLGLTAASFEAVGSPAAAAKSADAHADSFTDWQEVLGDEGSESLFGMLDQAIFHSFDGGYDSWHVEGRVPLSHEPLSLPLI